MTTHSMTYDTTSLVLWTGRCACGQSIGSVSTRGRKRPAILGNLRALAELHLASVDADLSDFDAL